MRTRRTVMSRLRTATILGSVLVLSACSTDGSSFEGRALPDYDPTPVSVNEAAPEVETDELRLPLQLEANPVVDPDWQTPPHYADEIFLSAADDDDVLTFRAVDATGTILWEAERPLSCTGFTLSSADDSSYAVLTDIEGEEDSFGHTVANAYDFHTGEPFWGPVEVPGPHQGPGTVFAAPPGEAMGETGPKVVLDPATGEVLLDENENSDVQILGEFHGTILVAHDAEVQAYDSADLAEMGLQAEPLWSIDPTDQDWDVQELTATLPVTTANPRSGAVLIGTDDTNRALIDLQDGDAVATQIADAGQDPSSQTWVTVGEALAGYDAQGQQLYEAPQTDLELVGVGGALAYMKNAEGDMQAHNVVTGDIGRAYDTEATGKVAIPTAISPRGTGILDTGESYYLSPAEE